MPINRDFCKLCLKRAGLKSRLRVTDNGPGFFCPFAHFIKLSDNPPENCPYILEHTLDSESAKRFADHLREIIEGHILES